MATPLTRKYDPAGIILALTHPTLGSQTAFGYAKGTFLKVGRYADAAKLTVGSDGEATVSYQRDRSGFSELTVQKASPFNDYLTSLANANETAPGSGVFSWSVTDVNGTMLAKTKKSWLKKKPDAEYEEEAGNVTWTMDCGQLDWNPGSNVET